MENRTKRLWIRVKESEYNDLKNKANGMGVSVSHYMRTRIFKSSEAATINAVEYLEIYREGVREMKKTGVNINQLARYANFLEKTGQVEKNIISEMMKQMQELIISQRKLADLDRKILKS